MRRQAIAFFLGDAAFLSDPKFRALARRLPHPDDFNSAVGAWFIALAAARRNGRPELDVMAETDSRFIDDLRQVGLLADSGFPIRAWEAWDAITPQQAAAGRVRADMAERDLRGRFTSAASVSSDTQRAGALDTAGPAPPAFPSPPLRSSQALDSSSSLSSWSPSAVPAREVSVDPKMKPETRPKPTRIGEILRRPTYRRKDWDAAAAAWDTGEFSEEWAPFRALARERGLLYPPTGTAMDGWDEAQPSQRALLIRAIRETPELLRTAISEAPQASWSAVLTIVLGGRDELATAIDEHPPTTDDPTTDRAEASEVLASVAEAAEAWFR